MRSALARIARIETALRRGACPICRGRVAIVWYREDELPPHATGCPCGRQRVLRWVSQSPASLDEALQEALERSDDYSFPLPKAGS